jgi:hypothetical protein
MRARFALGPILKGQLWETTVVRELRVQAHELARHLITLAAESRPVVRAETIFPTERGRPSSWPANPLEKSA